VTRTAVSRCTPAPSTWRAYSPKSEPTLRNSRAG
jgi:hypothetical protein